MKMLRSLPRELAHVPRRRWLSTAVAATKSINLTPYASPLLLRLHPDRMQRYAASHSHVMRDNEEALKQLNQFLEIAAFGCNNNGYRARKQILSLAAENHDDPNAAITWLLKFHVELDQPEIGTRLVPVDHVVEVPGSLVRRTLAHGAHSSTINTSESISAPFAREWQRMTKKILERLFFAAHIPLHTERDGEAATPTQLAVWLAEVETEEVQYERGVAAHNNAMRRTHENFDKMFHSLLKREKNIVHTPTTGLEDGPTTQHAILTRLVAQRLILEKIDNKDEKRRVFNWLANLLLMNFMELRLHSLVWNKVVLVVTKDKTLETPEVLWNSEQPEEGMAVLIPADMDQYALVDILYAHVDELERSLNEQAKRRTSQTTSSSTVQKKKKKNKHFYAEEVAALFRR